MAYYYRVFSSVDKNIWGDEIDAFIAEQQLGFKVVGVVDEEDEDNLEAIPTSLVLFDCERAVAELYLDKLETSEILADELKEFHVFVDEMLPAVNRAWVHAQLDKTIACYAFDIKKAGFEVANWDKLSILAGWLRDATEGVEQSDSGLITNENGAIVLEVPDDVDYEDDEDEFEDDELEEELEEFDPELDEEESLDENEVDEEEIDESEEWDNFEAAIREGDSWSVRMITSEEERQEFLKGNV